MAFVYEAKDRLLNRIVAVKVLRPEFVDDEEFLQKFKREAEAVANITHPNIVNVYDVGFDGKVNYIVMEYVDGKNLKEIIKDEGTLDEYTALDITKQIAKALGAAHKKGVIHRDIKPHNILISSEGRNVKVADFGIAKAVTNSTMTNVGSIIGSVHYFSPEQAKGKHIKNNADLYSLGIVLYEMILGKVPFKGDSPISIAIQHINENIEFSQEERTRVPQSIRTLIKKLTEKSPDDRYQSSEEVIEDIEYIEQNIDLDFIKQYDDFATRRTPAVEVVKIKEPKKQITKEIFKEEEFEEYDEYEDEAPVRKNTGKKVLTATLLIFLLGGVGVLGMATNGFGIFNSSSSNTVDDLIEVPNLVGMSWQNANQIAKDLGLKVELEEKYSEEVKKDHVISQTPSQGELRKGDTITIVASLGTENLQVPNIVGITEEEARRELDKLGLKLKVKDYQFSSIYEKGEIIERSSNTNLKKGDTIEVIVSKGKENTSTGEDLENGDANNPEGNLGEGNEENLGNTTSPETNDKDDDDKDDDDNDDDDKDDDDKDDDDKDDDDKDDVNNENQSSQDNLNSQSVQKEDDDTKEVNSNENFIHHDMNLDTE